MTHLSLGPAMMAGLRELERHGGAVPSAYALALHIGPKRSARYGYPTVCRMRDAGLITIDPTHPKASPQGLGAVVLTERGRSILAAYRA